MDNNYYIDVHYSLYVKDDEGKPELVEKTSDERPYRFISGLGFTLEKFEQEILALNEGDNFNFTLSVEDAYGEYIPEHVLELSKDIFTREGKFDSEHVFPGAMLPMINEDGNRLEGIVMEIKDNVVVMDFNDPLAGKELNFKGKIITKRLATEEEVDQVLSFTRGGCCHGGCHHGDGDCCHGDGCHSDGDGCCCHKQS